MANWNRTSVRNIPEYRRNEDMENLLIFGYHCKLFRDDSKAKHLDQGRHLIPWMGEPSLMIDRYDGRGHLHDLWPYDSDNPSNRGQQLSADEQQMEELCDEERYLELHTDVAVKEMYEEEELKRLNEAISSGYGAVGFSYDAPNNQDTGHDQEPIKVEEEEPYYAPPELQVPTDVIPPETVKLNQIIEKTALFISKHSAQMEIMIKMKQKNNAQFAFLEYSDPLNPYYKHMVKMIKSGKYKVQSERKKSESESEKQHYLHPSLSKAAEEPPMKEQTREEFMIMVSSQLPSGQIANTPYAKLLSNLSKHTGRNSPQPSVKLSPPPASVPVATSRHGVVHSDPLPSGYGQPDQYEHYGPSLPPGMGEVVQGSGDALGVNGQPPPPGTVPPGPLPIGSGQHVDLDGISYEEPTPIHGPHVIPPPPDIQPIIDKMAVYVAKNGPEFELIVRRKNDLRFEFLNDGHVHNPYYEHKKTLFQQEMAEAKKEQEVQKAAEAKKKKVPTAEPNDKTSQQNKSISFSLRCRENPENISSGLRTTALLYESSDEEDETVEKRNGDAKVEQQVSTDMTIDMLVDTHVKFTKGMEKKQAESRLKDKLAHAARDKLAKASKENQVKAERKRKAAMFINMLKTQPPPVAKVEAEVSSPVQETAVVAAAVAPSVAASSTTSPPPSPVPNFSTSSIGSRGSTPLRLPTVCSSHSPDVSRSRSKSPKRRSRSPSWKVRKSRSRSPRRRRKRSKTPPSSYHVRTSPTRKRRSPEMPARYKRVQRHSRSRSRERKSRSAKPRKSRSRSKTRNKSPSLRTRKRSRSQTRPKKRSRSRSRTRKRSKSPTRKRSRSRSKTKKSKSKKKKHESSSKSPKKRRSDDKKSHGRSKSSREARERSSYIIGTTDATPVVIPDDGPSQSERKDSPLIIESDTGDSSGDSVNSTPVRPVDPLQDGESSAPSSPNVIDSSPTSERFSKSPSLPRPSMAKTTKMSAANNISAPTKVPSAPAKSRTTSRKAAADRAAIDMFAD